MAVPRLLVASSNDEPKTSKGRKTGKRYTDEELNVIVQRELDNSLGGPQSEIAATRARNLQFYDAQAEGELAAPDIEDRSAIVSTDVADTVEWMLPSLIRVFARNKDAMSCKARHPHYAPRARMVAEYLRKIFWERNDGFSVAYSVFKDGLMQKVGFGKVTWDDAPEDVEESYTGLLAGQLQKMIDDPAVEVIEKSERIDRLKVPDQVLDEQEDLAKQAQAQAQAAQMAQQQGGQPPAPPMPEPPEPSEEVLEAIGEEEPEQFVEVKVYDVRLRRRLRDGMCRVESCPPEEMRVHRRARYGGDVPFVAQCRQRTRAELEAEGYDLTDLPTTENAWSIEELQRKQSQGQTMAEDNVGELELFDYDEVYIRLDQNNDGVPEWLYVVRVGGQVAETETVADHPYFFFCPNPRSHVFFGDCPADFAIEPQRLNTSLVRGVVDNVYLNVNGRTAVLDGKVNLDDLTQNRPGGIVRVSERDAMWPIDRPQLDQGTWQMIEWGEQWRERRTGWTRYSQGMSPDALNPTATGVDIITERADQRVELIASVAARSMARMFRLILKCIGQYQQKSELVEIFDSWVVVDPREWANGYEVEVEVGLGTGRKERKAQALTAVYGMQQPLAQQGAIEPVALIETGRAFAEAAGLGDGKNYFPDPVRRPQMPPPQVMVKQMELQADAQRFQAEQLYQAQSDQRQHELTMAARRAELEVQAANDARDAEARALENQAKAELERMQIEANERAEQARLALEKYRADLEAQTKLAIAQQSAAPSVDVSALQAQMQALIDHLSAPAEIVRDPVSGKALGIRKVTAPNKNQGAQDQRPNGAA